MANFSITPTTGTGNGTISVTPLTPNLTHSDKEGVITVTNGSITRTVSAIQYGVPEMVLTDGDGIVPANGGRLTYSVYTRYPFGFRNVPDWITITDSTGRVYDSTSTYPATYANGGVFYLTVSPNNSTTSRSTANAAFRWKKDDDSDWQRQTSGINIEQEAAQSGGGDYISVSPSILYLDWNTMYKGSGVFTVDASTASWDFAINGDLFTAERDGENVIITATQNNASSSFNTGTIVFSLEDEEMVCFIRQYPQPTLSIGGSGNNVIPQGGGEGHLQIGSDYNWWLIPQPISDYITVSYDGSAVEGDVNHPIDGFDGYRTYTLSWNENTTGENRDDEFGLAYYDLNGNAQTLGYNRVRFRQLATSEVVQSVEAPDYLKVGVSGGRRRVLVTIEGPFRWYNVPDYITIYNDEGTECTNASLYGMGTMKTYYAEFRPWTKTVEEEEEGVTERYYHPIIYLNDGSTVESISSYRQVDEKMINFTAVQAYEFIPAEGDTREVLICSDYAWYWKTIPDFVTIYDENGNLAMYTADNPAIGDGSTHAYTIAFQEFGDEGIVNMTEARRFEPSIYYGEYGVAFAPIGELSTATYIQMSYYTVIPENIVLGIYDTQTVKYSVKSAPVDVEEYYPHYWLDVSLSDANSKTGEVILYNNAKKTEGDKQVINLRPYNANGPSVWVKGLALGASRGIAPSYNADVPAISSSKVYTISIYNEYRTTSSTADVSWIHIMKVSINSDEAYALLYYWVEDNNTINQRTGHINIVGGNSSNMTFTVQQLAGNPE